MSFKYEGFRVNVRALAATAVAAALLVGTAGCGVFVESATLKQYAASDGVSATVGDVELRNLILVTDETGDGSLIGTVVNNSGSAMNISVELRGSASEVQDVIISSDVTVLGVKDSTAVLFGGAGLAAGQYATIALQYGTNDTVEVVVPVLDSTDPLYAPYTPTLLAPTPVVTETPAPVDVVNQ